MWINVKLDRDSLGFDSALSVSPKKPRQHPCKQHPVLTGQQEQLINVHEAFASHARELYLIVTAVPGVSDTISAILSVT